MVNAVEASNHCLL